MLELLFHYIYTHDVMVLRTLGLKGKGQVAYQDAQFE
jgi:hypothetical protein